MRFNQTTLLNIALIVIFGLALTQAEAYMGDYQIYILKLIFINAILALSLNLIYGFTGLFSLGHAGFMAIGAYVGALCTLLPEQKEIMWILDFLGAAHALLGGGHRRRSGGHDLRLHHRRARAAAG